MIDRQIEADIFVLLVAQKNLIVRITFVETESKTGLRRFLVDLHFFWLGLKRITTSQFYNIYVSLKERDTIAVLFCQL
jgi:hypothetical protein